MSENEKPLLATADVAVIVAANGGIGRAVLENVLAEPRWSAVYATYHRDGADLTALAQRESRLTVLPVDLLDERSLQSALQTIQKQHSSIGMLCCAAGLLHEDGLAPEKRLADLSADSLRRVFEINSVGPIMLLKHFQPLLSEPAVVAMLSAKVGSIEDNYLGGWHSYRASKAALNMLLKTASIELGRRNKQLALFAFHPGTTDTDLSKPFQRNVAPEKLFSPERCAEQLLKICESLRPQDNGSFIAWDGERLPW